MAKRFGVTDETEPLPGGGASATGDVLSVAPPVEPEPSVSMEDRLMKVLEKLAEGRKQDDPMLREIAAGMQALAEATRQGHERVAQETKRAARPSNEQVPFISPYNPRGNMTEGYTKPLLLCEMYLPWVADDASLTREEVELLNLLCRAGSAEYGFTCIDDERKKAKVIVEMDVQGTRPNRLVIFHETAFNRANYRNLPALRLWLREMLAQAPEPFRTEAKAVMTMDEEVRKITSGELAVTR